MASDKQMFVQVTAFFHSNIAWLWQFMYYFCCESLPWCSAAWQEVCAPAVCWPVGWEDRAALWARRDTGIALWGEIWMVPSSGTHADTLGQCWICAPGRRVASKCLGAALGEAETSFQHSVGCTNIAADEHKSQDGAGGLQLVSKTMAVGSMGGHSHENSFLQARVYFQCSSTACGAARLAILGRSQ